MSLLHPVEADAGSPVGAAGAEPLERCPARLPRFFGHGAWVHVEKGVSCFAEVAVDHELAVVHAPGVGAPLGAPAHVGVLGRGDQVVRQRGDAACVHGRAFLEGVMAGCGPCAGRRRAACFRRTPILCYWAGPLRLRHGRGAIVGSSDGSGRGRRVLLPSQHVPCELPGLRERPAEQEAHHQELADGDGGELVGRVYDLGDARGEHDGEEP